MDDTPDPAEVIADAMHAFCTGRYSTAENAVEDLLHILEAEGYRIVRTDPDLADRLDECPYLPLAVERPHMSEHWTENCDGTAYDQVGQSDYGTLWVARRNERHPERHWTIPFRRWDPRCWRAWFNSARRGECTFLEAL